MSRRYRGRRRLSSSVRQMKANQMLDAEMRDRLESGLRAHDLKGLVVQMRRSGLTQVAIYTLFEAFYSELGEAGRVAEEDEVGGALDRIWGWCPRNAMWFDDTLTEEVVRAYHKDRSVSGQSAEPPATPPGDERS